MRAVDLILKKRSGGELNPEELNFLIQGYVQGSVPDYQIAAWAMAVYFQGMTSRETGKLTELMIKSGKIMDLSGLSGPLVDKHSTGGVGDKTSLILAPLVACLGVKVPMMSGRALGHTGGTLDKLEAIPGYRVRLSEAEFRSGLSNEGFAMTGQTDQLAPADRLLYSLRDVTATVESIPLITASILSKKVAEGAEALVFDVKFGSGAFMKNPKDAEALARSLADTGAALGKPVIALLTDMEEPLGNTVGNFLEIEESLDCLEGRGPSDLMEVTLELAARMLILGGKASSVTEARALCEAELATSRPRDLFLANVRRQGGDPERLLEWRGSYRSEYTEDIRAERSAYIGGINAYAVGAASVTLGVGRNRVEDAVSPVAGILFHKKRGDRVSKGDAIMSVWGKDAKALETALPALRSAITFSASPPPPRQLILKEIST